MALKFGAIIYSRLNSLRLPEKALLKINNSRLIDLVIDSAQKINADVIILGTSLEKSDNPLEDIAIQRNINLVRGALADVARRTIDCIEQFQLDYIIRLNGDSPIVPYCLINEGINSIREDGSIQFVTNLVPRSYPYGYSVEILNANTFKSSYPFFSVEEREHITKYFYNSLEKFKVLRFENRALSKAKQLPTLTVDDEASFSFMTELFDQHPLIQDYSIDKILSIGNEYK